MTESGKVTKLAIGIVIAVLAGAGAAIWAHEGRITRNETRNENFERRMDRFEGKLDEVLRRLPPQ